MQFYSTNHSAARATLRDAVVRGLAEDRGLYMPEVIKQLPDTFWDEMTDLTFQEIAYRVADAFFGEDVEAEALRRIVNDTLAFDVPAVRVEEHIYSLELFHGPTLAFKDVGARFMARLLQYFISQQATDGEAATVNVLVATSGDTGSAVANGFLGVEGIHVYVLYPKGKVSPIQECQFTTLGRNITAIEVDGVFDDCQALVKSAFMDKDLNAHMRLTSANSINVARFLPQAFYYFYAYAQLRKLGLTGDGSTEDRRLVVCVPSGNFGNICSALFGHAMGLPVKRFIAANNANDIFYKYLQTGHYEPKASQQTIANAMDVGDPSNFARILDLYGREDIVQRLQQHGYVQPMPSLTDGRLGGTFITGATYTDDQIAETMRTCYAQTGYVLDPHGACGYRALKEQLQPGETGIFLETAHPAKFKDTVDHILGIDLPIPEKLQAFMRGEKKSVAMSKTFEEFKDYLMNQ
ncbi:MAG: threonine synthase [Bacteroidales bacterium]|nr:threonine synthase [Bacteroidales bacterium]